MIGQLGESAVAAVGVANLTFSWVLFILWYWKWYCDLRSTILGQKTPNEFKVSWFNLVDEHQRGFDLFPGGNPVPGAGDKYLLKRSSSDLSG